MPQKPSFSDLYEQSLKATDIREALRWHSVIRDLIQMSGGPVLTVEEASELIRKNLGYHGDETRARVERLYKTEHPQFGKIEELGPPTDAEALTLGYNHAGKIGPQTLKELRNEKKRNELSYEGSS